MSSEMSGQEGLVIGVAVMVRAGFSIEKAALALSATSQENPEIDPLTVEEAKRLIQEQLKET